MKILQKVNEEEYNSRILRDENKWLFYAEGFGMAAELIGKQVLGDSRTDQDLYIYPYCYLIRHFIEVRLKEIIDEGAKILGIDVNPTKGKHDLSILWKSAQTTLKEVWKGQTEPNEARIVEDIINELHSVDQMSDNFRYPIDKSGKPTLKGISIINFKQLVEVFVHVRLYFNSITDGLAEVKRQKEINKHQYNQ